LTGKTSISACNASDVLILDEVFSEPLSLFSSLSSSLSSDSVSPPVMELREGRAEAVVNYLSSKNVSSER